MLKNITVLNSVCVNNFRGLQNVDIKFGKRLTVICGKNGTSKSTILGIIAQAFSFDKDVTKSPHRDLSSFKTIRNKSFKSNPREHFKISKDSDPSGSMDVEINVFDGGENKELNVKLTLVNSTDRRAPRPVVRGNTVTNDANSSRNITHPVIYLGLNRLMPIADRTDYSAEDVAYFDSISGEFMKLNNQILTTVKSSKITATKGSIKSVVAHGKSYNHECVSSGEDNVGQMLQALFSFKKLKDEYDDYHGGILLIDEADAGLFPGAQVEFIKVLSKIAKDLSLQVVMTTHSPLMIEETLALAGKAPGDYKTIYLTDSYGKVEAKENFSWPEIYADLMVKTLVLSNEFSLPKPNIYFEDDEAFDFFCSLIRPTVRQKINLMKGVKIGCKNYLELIKKKIPEFHARSVIVFDADVSGVGNINNVVKLPGGVPPDQLVFDCLVRLPPGDDYWKGSEIGFTKSVFVRCANKIITRLGIELDDLDGFDLQAAIVKDSKEKSPGDEPIRDLFKKFYNDKNIQGVIHGKVARNPFRIWQASRKDEVEKFRKEFETAIKHVLMRGYGVGSEKINGYI